jgi:hypothetical protein
MRKLVVTVSAYSANRVSRDERFCDRINEIQIDFVMYNNGKKDRSLKLLMEARASHDEDRMRDEFLQNIRRETAIFAPEYSSDDDSSDELIIEIFDPEHLLDFLRITDAMELLRTPKNQLNDQPLRLPPGN